MTGPRLDRRRVSIGLAALPVLGAAACVTGPRPAVDAGPGVAEDVFGTAPSGETVRRFTLTNRGGRAVRIMTWGAAVTSLLMPDRDRALAEVVLGLDTFDDYLARSRNFGATVGRYAGRIGGGRFILDGETVQLDTGGGAHSSHGGPVGFAKRHWTPFVHSTPQGPSVTMTLSSADGDQGFPGRLDIRVTYGLTHDDRLTLEFEAETTRPTVLNPTHHSYFNLSGVPGSTILDHDLTLDAEAFTPFDADKLVTGEYRPVAGTPFDFRAPKALGRDIDADDDQIRIGGGYDHAFLIRGGAGLRRAARLDHALSGRRLELWTTEPGVQVYTANTIDMVGRGGVAYGPHCGVALEPQHFQNSPNRPEFPSTTLKPGQVFRSRSEYRFGVIGRG